MNDYQSKQVARWGLALAAGMVLVGGGLAFAFLPSGAREGITVGLLVIALLISNFAVLNVRVTDHEVRWRFGVLFGKTVLLDEVRSVEVRRSPWYWGWGLRWTPHGWLWRATGLDDTWLHLGNGKQVGVGSPDPEALAREIAERAGVEFEGGASSDR